ncbi:hypothetical protein [Neorhizobium sp. DT-125]|uniref:hypothetical protein n=1 Tax=Neorhizobium sp. DT-125 TaxID=3396163 RepID=UPI003F1C87AB
MAAGQRDFTEDTTLGTTAEAMDMHAWMLSGWYYPTLSGRLGQRVLRSPAFMAATSSVIRASYISIGGSAARKSRWAERKTTFAFSPRG